MLLPRRMLGPDLVEEQLWHVRFASRVVNITDLVDIRDEMAKICPRATINRDPYDSDHPGDEIPDVYKAADADLKGLSVNGWFDDGPAPALRLTVGVDLSPQLAFQDSAAIPEPEPVAVAGRDRIASVLLRRGHRTLSRQNMLDLLRTLSLLPLLGLVVWLGILIWPNIPALLVSVLAIWAFQRAVLDHLLGRIVDRSFPHQHDHHVVVRHISREAQRVARGKWIVGVATAAVTAFVTVVATYVAIVMTGAS